MQTETTTAARRLQVGDVVYHDNGAIISRYTITRVTGKQAICGINDSIRLKIEVSENGWVSEIASTWSRRLYRVETPELLAKWQRQRLVAALGRTSWGDLPTDTLRQVAQIVKQAKISSDEK